MESMVVLLATVLLGLPLAGLAWHLLGQGLGSGFVIRYNGTGPAVVRGRVPRAKVGSIQEFCSRDLGAAGAFTVRGAWRPDRRLELRYRGRLTQGQRQQMRNFLVQCLG